MAARSSCTATRDRCCRWRSIATAIAWSAQARTERCGCGTLTEARRSWCCTLIKALRRARTSAPTGNMWSAPARTASCGSPHARCVARSPPSCASREHAPIVNSAPRNGSGSWRAVADSAFAERFLGAEPPLLGEGQGLGESRPCLRQLHPGRERAGEERRLQVFRRLLLDRPRMYRFWLYPNPAAPADGVLLGGNAVPMDDVLRSDVHPHP